MDIKKVVGERIKSIRKKKGIGQESLSNMAQIHRTHMSLIERGQSNMTIEVLEKVAHALDVEVYELLKPC